MEHIYKEDFSTLPFHKPLETIIHPNEAVNLSNSVEATPDKYNDIINPEKPKLNRRIGLVKNTGFLLNDLTQEKENKIDVIPIPILKKKNIFEIIKESLSSYHQGLVRHYITIFFILLALFSVDCKVLIISANLEDGFTIYYSIVILYFFIDMIMNISFNSSYLISFYSALDLCCIVFMVLEIENLVKIIGNCFHITFNHHNAKYPDHNQVEKYLRIIRIFRMMHLVKLYYSVTTISSYFIRKRNIKKIEELRQKKLDKKRKISEEKKNKRKISVNVFPIKPSVTMIKTNQLNTSYIAETKNLAYNDIARSTSSVKKNDEVSQTIHPLIIATKKNHFDERRINTVITKKTNQKIILIIIIMYLLNPLTDDNLNICAYEYTFNVFSRFINKIYESNEFLFEYQGKELNDFFNNMTVGNYPIINITYEEKVLFVNQSIKQECFRYEEIGYSILPPGKALVTFSLKEKTRIRASVSICRTIFTFFLLLFLSLSLSQDAKRLLLNPLEDMIAIVDVVARDPVNSKQIEDLKKSCQSSIENMKKKNHSSDYEIKIIQFAVIRISALLAIGFGEAGGEILKENIQSSEGLNPMLQGKKIEAIFGFCYIRHFAEINEALQEKTMIFVNKISEIVHASVDKFGGITNKNLGDCFLLVWKIKLKRNSLLGTTFQTQKQTTIIEDERSCMKSDEALLAFLSIIKKINKSQSILAYRNNPSLQEKMGKGFKVQMGFGLHRGWGIEGAIGSFYKIDCSYLSPNVNIAARLETATNIYGVDILFSGEFYDTLSTFMKRLCRQVDVVALKGCVTPVKLYTVDINPNLHPGKLKSNNKKFNIRERRIKKSKLRNIYEEDHTKTIGEIYMSKSKGLKHLLHKTKTEAFISYFDDGFNNYIDGDWEEACGNLKSALYLDKTDGPAKTLLAYMRKHNKKPPTDWDGFRKLDAKF